ncbi:hypothetical protein ES705_50630 [subsurface metagenome]
MGKFLAFVIADQVRDLAVDAEEIFADWPAGSRGRVIVREKIVQLKGAVSAQGKGSDQGLYGVGKIKALGDKGKLPSCGDGTEKGERYFCHTQSNGLDGA